MTVAHTCTGLYVHVPFCRRRCSYCDFYFEVRVDHADFASLVIAELNQRHEECPAQRFATISLGGGTPSALPVPQLAQLVTQLRGWGDQDVEVALEANPEDLLADSDWCHRMRDAGLTRISLGLQSFDDAALRYLGRAHDAIQGLAVVEQAVRSGLSTSVDLIIGVPGDDRGRVVADAAKAHRCGVQHVSAYVLTLESGTPLVQLIGNGKRAPINDDHQADAYEDAQQVLAAHGYRQYEVSSYAVPGHESRHNRLYWQHQPYVGIGPGAHSLARLPNQSSRRHNDGNLQQWSRALRNGDPPPHGVEQLDGAAAWQEAVAFCVRDGLQGVSPQRLAADHQINDGDMTAVLRSLEACAQRGWLQHHGDRYVLTTVGFRFADAVARSVLTALD
jgi:putative oxygen-independent coproporphyrinogen III oxidase